MVFGGDSSTWHGKTQRGINWVPKQKAKAVNTPGSERFGLVGGKGASEVQQRALCLHNTRTASWTQQTRDFLSQCSKSVPFREGQKR